MQQTERSKQAFTKTFQKGFASGSGEITFPPIKHPYTNEWKQAADPGEFCLLLAAWWLLPCASGLKLEVGSPLAFSNFETS